VTIYRTRRRFREKQLPGMSPACPGTSQPWFRYHASLRLARNSVSSGAYPRGHSSMFSIA
jgi:hypothetical protein